MQEEQSPADKPHEPTPRRLEDARKKGEIVRSTDLNTAVIYAGFLLTGGLFAAWATETLGSGFIGMWGQAHSLSDMVLSDGGSTVAAGLAWPGLLVLSLFFLFPAGLLFLALTAQRGLLFTPSKIAPKLSRISPISNAKQKFGAEGLFTFAKSAVKLFVTSALLGVYLWARLDLILVSIYAEDGQILALLGRMVFEFMAMVTVIAAVIGGIDWAWEWAQHQKKNRMSRQEIMDETKSSEGDPQMKQMRRQKAQSLAMNRMMGDVPGADVVVVNPTHYAVALKWDRSGGAVPVCVAKGVDEVARKIREVAAEAGVPIFSDPPTARALHATVAIGAPITADHFQAVAAAIRFADLMRAKARRR